MTSIDPPSGITDLSGQADDIARERAQLAAERVELEQAKALVRQRREREDRPVILDPAGHEYPPAAATASTPAVIDPDGTEYELDEDGNPQRDGEGKPIPVGEYDRYEDGRVVLGDDGIPLPVWPHHTVTLKGHLIQVRKPKPEAAQAVALASGKYTPVQTQNDMVALFVRQHISPRSYAELLERMIDPDMDFTMADFGELFQQIATLDTARPTGPSRP